MTIEAAQVEDAARPTSPLGYRQFRELWTANASSNLGSQIQVVAASWLMASLTQSPQLIALVQTAIALPTVLFILAGGAMADNFDRRRIMLTCQIAMLVLASTLSSLSWLGLISPWSLLALIFAISIFSSVSNPCWQASVRDILPRDMISRAVALNSMSINLARTAGPALGGLIVTLLGVSAAFVANALSFVAFIAALIRWTPIRTPRTAPREQILPAMVAGVRYAARAPNVRNAVIRGGLSGLSASAAFALLPVVARLKMDGSALLYGLLLAAFGGGAIVSAWIGGRLRSRATPDQVVAIAVVCLSLGLSLLAWSPDAVIAGLGAALCGSGWVLAHSTYNTTVQLSAPAWVTARSLALYQTATFAGMAAGSGLFGWVAEHNGVSVALFAASAAQVAAGLAGFAFPLPRYEDIQIDPLDRWRPPTLEVEIGPNEGPVLVELEYRIAPEHVLEFTEAMTVREQIRRRDGARDWAVWQDLADGTRWTESYRVPNWAEYLRHNSRRTMADLDNADLLLRLNADPGGPVVRRMVRRRRRPARTRAQ